MAGNCIDDGCGVDLSVVGGALHAEAVISPAACNGISCTPEGLYVQKDESRVQAGTVPDPSGWEVDLATLTPGVPTVVAISPVNTFTNESTCFESNVISCVTAREVQFNGPEGGFFTVEHQEDRGAGFNDLFNSTADYRFAFTGTGNILDARAGGAAVRGDVLAPGASFNYQYRIVVTRYEGDGFVTSPGLTYCHLSMTN